MLLTPRYDAPPLIAIAPRVPGVHPVVQQRERLGDVLGDLGADEWEQPSRCEDWSVRHVITHLVSTNQFWLLSIMQALAGEPTRFLARFDPVASPAQLVEQDRGTPWAATFEAYRASSAELVRAVESLDDRGWDAIGEAPPGHVPLRLVADHALWDCWVHERDILLPLGRTPVEDEREVLTCLRYAAALGRAFELARGRGGGGAAVLEVTEPDARIVVEVGDEQVQVHEDAGPADARSVRLGAVTALEMLSRRDAGEPEPEAIRWLAAGLATVFDEEDVVERA
ncbi:MAG: maleylpyruvate isomerase family mycothiol-dependent enzyme [Acidimicrobiales bacterium]